MTEATSIFLWFAGIVVFGIGCYAWGRSGKRCRKCRRTDLAAADLRGLASDLKRLEINASDIGKRLE